MKLVVGTDFSENARVAGITAAALARRWSDTLALAHVFDDSVSHRLPGDVRETLAASTKRPSPQRGRASWLGGRQSRGAHAFWGAGTGAGGSWRPDRTRGW